MSDAARECEVLLDKALDTIKQWRAENADLTARLASAERVLQWVVYPNTIDRPSDAEVRSAAWAALTSAAGGRRE